MAADTERVGGVGDEDAASLLRFARDFGTFWADRPVDLHVLLERAVDAVPHTLAAGLTVVRGDRPPRTLAASNAVAAQLDAIENEVGQGPCIEALEEDDLVHCPDLAAESRWPDFTARALRETPVRSMFGVRVYLGAADRGALDFYAAQPHAFTDYDLGVGAVFSSITSLALQREIHHTKAVNLEHALESSRQIGMAMGILMARRLLTAEQAFEELRAASQALHRKLRDIAAEVTETGTLPELPAQ